MPKNQVTAVTQDMANRLNRIEEALLSRDAARSARVPTPRPDDVEAPAPQVLRRGNALATREPSSPLLQRVELLEKDVQSFHEHVHQNLAALESRICRLEGALGI
jgi:hypothetical protein